MRLKLCRWCLVAFVAACSSHKEAAPPPPAPPPAAPVVPADASVADAPSAAMTFTKLPDFGCIAWSPARKLVACVLGTSAVNTGTETSVSLVLSPLASGVDAPAPIAIAHVATGRAPQELAPAVAAKLTDALRGFEPLDRGAATIAWQRGGDNGSAGPASAVGGLPIAVHFDPDGTGTAAPKYHLTMSVGGHQVADQNDTLSAVTIRSFALGDAVIVDEEWATGDEGMYSSNGDAWRCTKAGCEKLEAP